MNKMPKEMKLPKHWKKFVNEQDVMFNLIIKSGKDAQCTNCGKHFYSKSQEGKEYGYKDVCPFCNNEYLVRRSNLKNYFFLYDLAIVDNVNNKLILRYFEIERTYVSTTKKFRDNIVEYARIVPEYDIELVNDRFLKYLAVERVYHTKKIKKWRIFTGKYGLSQYYKAIYVDDMQEKIKGTVYEYAPLKEAVNYLKNDKVNFLKLLQKAKYPSFELLIKMGLYKLALDQPEKFNIKGNFEKRFGVDRKYYKFMVKHNISIDELEILKMIHRPNIRIIRSLYEFSGKNINQLREISKYINLIKFEEYRKSQKKFSIYSYFDYIRNLQKLGVPLTKKMLMPENFKEAHDTSVDKVQLIINDSKLLNREINKRYNELSKNIYNDDIYIIRPAKSLKDLKDEAKQQNNCVYKNYSESYAFGETDIYFLRKLENPKKSLVTIEVNDKQIIQKEQKNHGDLSEEQLKILNYWEENIIKKVA